MNENGRAGCHLVRRELHRAQAAGENRRGGEDTDLRPVCSAEGRPRRISSSSRFASKRHGSDMPPSLRRSWQMTEMSRKRNM